MSLSQRVRSRGVNILQIGGCQLFVGQVVKLVVRVEDVWKLVFLKSFRVVGRDWDGAVENSRVHEGLVYVVGFIDRVLDIS